MISVGAVPFSTHAVMASRMSCRASEKPGTLWTLSPSMLAWFAPAKYHGAFMSGDVLTQCLRAALVAGPVLVLRLMENLLHARYQEEAVEVI